MDGKGARPGIGARNDAAPSWTIRPRKGWTSTSIRELWTFRELLVRFGLRDITLRYRQTFLGVIWVVLQPLLGAGVLAFVFGRVANLRAPNHLPYFLYSFVGMICWTTFSQVLTRSSMSLVTNAGMIGKVFFPRLILPLSTLVSIVLDLLVSLMILVALMALDGVSPSSAVIALPLAVLLGISAGLGLGILTGALMVRYRDVGYVVPVFVQFMLFASPVAYSLDSVPADARFVYQLNPLAGALELVRWAALSTERPSAGLLSYSIASTLVLVIVGLGVFGRMERQFADVL